ncbi:hypothetical protein PC129_g4510 [Phytophthora cactorum]|uniref:Retrotransposon gag domain-containing protein n=1 Tax=Phytophthora cactorum TaxID=29920 RepID=A0A8T1IHT2_9STRA|nr:hypothetical protein PC115_g5413 [Phytophthora cactorum]KAG2990752.1 hypothetical protein PC118_g5459 [Phytophthora cactorum]KAG3076844.1 hypothetical protein PC121_g7584 [Phytophthora cactorum]KAG3179804.1 hypothetical protein C6341_g7289 [Phytophthora cactorum]KAG3224835.1 hypothetical protein PC129_g4510 [Phytophthora cactorum]
MTAILMTETLEEIEMIQDNAERPQQVHKLLGEKTDGLEVGVQRWWNKFSLQVRAAEIYAGSRAWPDDVKVTILGDFLTGMAEAWYDDMNAQLQMLTFAQVGAELIKHFRTAMTDLQITTQMCTSRKKASETYQQFANRLLGMADLIKGGRAAEHNARLALQSFCAHAYPTTQ